MTSRFAAIAATLFSSQLSLTTKHTKDAKNFRSKIEVIFYHFF